MPTRPTTASQAALTEGTVAGVLFRQFVPLLSGSLVFASVSIVEGYFIAGLGTDALAVFGQLSPFILLATGMFFGFANGVTSTISRAIGAGRSADASTAAAISYVLVLPFVGIYLAICYFLSGSIYRIMGGKAELFDLFLAFLKIWACAIPVGVLLYVSTAILRARGAAIIASIAMSASALTNCVLGAIFMFGLAGVPKLGLAGAALSNLLGMLFAGGTSVAYLKRSGSLTFSLKSAGPLARDILVGSSFAIGTYCIQPIGRFLLLAIMGWSGKEIIASLAVFFLIDRFMLNVFVALSSALAPLVGQNWGKRRFERVRQGITTAVSWVVIIGMAAWFTLWIFGSGIAAVFSASPTVFEFVKTGLTIYPAYIMISALVLICCAAFNATANAAYATGFVTLGQIVTIPACVYFGGAAYGYRGMLLGMVAGQMTVAMPCLIFIYRKVARASEGYGLATEAVRPIVSANSETIKPAVPITLSR